MNRNCISFQFIHISTYACTTIGYYAKSYFFTVSMILYTVFCVKSALGAFEIRIKKILLIIAILHLFLKNLRLFFQFFVIYNHIRVRALIRGWALITQSTVLSMLRLPSLMLSFRLSPSAFGIQWRSILFLPKRFVFRPVWLLPYLLGVLDLKVIIRLPYLLLLLALLRPLTLLLLFILFLRSK